MTAAGPHVWWTGREATALRRAMALTAERFADRVGVSARTVANWAANPAMVPRLSIHARLDDVLHSLPPHERARFLSLTAPPPPQCDDLSEVLAAIGALSQRAARLMEAL